MKTAFGIVSIALVLAGLLTPIHALANCQYDVVGTTQATPEWSFTPDGQVTYGMANWWEDDLWVCYQTYLHSHYMTYFSACDFDGNGLVDWEEVLEIFYFVRDYPTGGVPAYAYQCEPGFPCPDDMPAFYDPSGSDAEWAASGVCTEMNGPSGPPACPQEQHDRLVSDMNHILTTYPWTNAVFDGYQGAGQTFNPMPYTLICGAGSGAQFPTDLFDDVNACYHGTPDWLFEGALAVIRFDWGVNTDRARQDYDGVARTVGGHCNVDALVGGGPTGFHAQTMPGNPWILWTVRSTARCSYAGCGCDATLELYINSDGRTVLRSLENNSNFDPSQGPLCEDLRFDF